MSHDIDHMNVIESPCTKRCQPSKHGSYCTGCGRTMLDISKWRKYNPVQKKRAAEEAKVRLYQQRRIYDLGKENS